VDYVYAKDSGVRPWNGAQTHFTKGEAWRADDPFVAAHRTLFQDEPPTVRSTRKAPAGDSGVERATRRPGERRG
jgi:hypothetical protein